MRILYCLTVTVAKFSMVDRRIGNSLILHDILNIVWSAWMCYN